MRDMNPPPSPDRSIRNIPVPANHRRMAMPPGASPGEEEPAGTGGRPTPPRRSRRSLFIWSAVIVVIACAVVGLLVSTLFTGATITVTPHSESVTPPATMLAMLNAPAGTLQYQIITMSQQGTTSVAANGTEQVSRQASGVITIYNAYSAAAQKLIANTRFQAPDGKIYRIHQAVTVPGETGGTPGSVSVTAYADQPGADYNRGATQFTIPGFVGDPRYTKMSAQTAGMTGGLVGTEPSVAPADLASAQAKLEQGLADSLQGATGKIPQGFVVIPGTLHVTYSGVTKAPGQDNSTAVISEVAQGSADAVSLSDLAANIAKQTVQGYGGEAVNFADPSQITIALASSTKPAGGALTLALSGSPTLVWQFDPNALKQALLGKSKSQFETILQSFSPAIQCSTDAPCKASIRPFWTSTFPSNPDKINVVTGP